MRCAFAGRSGAQAEPFDHATSRSTGVVPAGSTGGDSTSSGKVRYLIVQLKPLALPLHICLIQIIDCRGQPGGGQVWKTPGQGGRVRAREEASKRSAVAGTPCWAPRRHQRKAGRPAAVERGGGGGGGGLACACQGARAAPSWAPPRTLPCAAHSASHAQAGTPRQVHQGSSTQPAALCQPTTPRQYTHRSSRTRSAGTSLRSSRPGCTGCP